MPKKLPDVSVAETLADRIAALDPARLPAAVRPKLYAGPINLGVLRP